MPANILDQALNAAAAIEALDRLGVDPRQTRAEMLQGLEARGVSAEPGTVIRSLVDAIRPGDAVSVNGETYRVTDVRPGAQYVQPDYAQIEMRIAAQFLDPPRREPVARVPGGRALQYQPTTRIRLSGSRVERLRPCTVRFTVPKDPPMTNPCGEMDLGFSGRAMDQYMAGDCTAHAKLTMTKLDMDTIMKELGLDEPKYEPKSVWWWLRNPAL